MVDRSVYALPTAMPPIYQRIARILRGRIFHRVYPPGGAIPSENDLSREFGVTRLTVRQALRELREEGVLESVRGSGTFVAEHVHVLRPITFLGYLEDVVLQSITLEMRVGSAEQIVPNRKVRDALRLAPQVKVLRIERYRDTESVPVIYAVNYLPLAIASGLPTAELSRIPLIELMAERRGVVTTHATQSITAVNASAALARKMEVEVGTALLHSDFVSYSASRPVNFAEIYYRPEHTFFTALLTSMTAGGIARQNGKHGRTVTATR